jgi:flavin-dependent dehydrogenase
MIETVDIAVIGAGTAGALAAARLAALGRSVLLLDAGDLEQAGARWVNGLPEGELARLGVPPPEPEHKSTFHLVAGWGPQRVTVRDAPIVDHDMRWLVGALHAQAREAGAALRGRAGVAGVSEDSGGVTVRLRDGGEIRASLVVDAAGMTGPTGRAPCPPHRICAAAQEIRALADPEAASDWLDRHGAKPGETLSFAGVAGGYSIVNVRVELEPQPLVALLTGSIPALGHAPGIALLKRFIQDHPWVGALRFGGARPIPLTAAEPIVAQGRIVRLGDAARMVYATHGSGIAMGMRAADLLARTLAEGVDPWDFNVRFQRDAGAVIAASAAVAAWTARLDLAAVRSLVVTGLMHPALIADGLRQLPPRLDLAALPDLAAAAARRPDLAASMAPTLLAAARLQAHQHRYPSTPERVPAWHAARHRLLVSVGAA